MHLTPDILERAYEYIRSTPPFNSWSLPEADAVQFRVSGIRSEFGSLDFTGAANEPIISISQRKCHKTQDLIATMAHECVHLHQFSRAAKGREPADHGPVFQRLAKQVCRSHGFDPTTF